VDSVDTSEIQLSFDLIFVPTQGFKLWLDVATGRTPKIEPVAE
jgi:hypothetical protein